MKSPSPRSYTSARNALASPFTDKRVHLNHYTVMAPDEIAVQESDLSAEWAVAAKPSQELLQKLALKAVSGTMKAPERAQIIFNKRLKPTTSEAAILYGAVSNSVRNRRNSHTTFQAAEEAGFIDNLTITGEATDSESSFSFTRNGHNITLKGKRHHSAAGFLWAMSDALVDISGLGLTQLPQESAQPNLARPTVAVSAFLRSRGLPYQPVAQLHINNPQQLEDTAYNHALLLSGNGHKIQ